MSEILNKFLNFNFKQQKNSPKNKKNNFLFANFPIIILISLFYIFQKHFLVKKISYIFICIKKINKILHVYGIKRWKEIQNLKTNWIRLLWKHLSRQSKIILLKFYRKTY